MVSIDATPDPSGDLALQTIAMPADTNANGDIFGGWLVSQMDLAGGVAAGKIAQGRVATVAIDKMAFMVPVKVGVRATCTRYCSAPLTAVQFKVTEFRLLLTPHFLIHCSGLKPWQNCY